MKKKILSLDLGGTAVKIGLFEDDNLVKTASWRHDYKDCGLEKAKEDLLKRSLEFCDTKVDLVGLGVAGLLATDNTLFRSTVISSFKDFNIGQFLKDKFGAFGYSQDNDADCGALGEYYLAKHELFYVVVGSGIGSACVDVNGNLMYPVRINNNLQFSEEMNHPISDAGLRLSLNDDDVEKIFGKVGAVLPANNDFYKSLHEEDRVRMGNLGSAIGVGNLLKILWNGKFDNQETVDYYRNYLDRDKGLSSDLYSRRYAAEQIARLAFKGEPKSIAAYRLQGRFLGLTISKAENILHQDHDKFFPVHLGGKIMGSADLFLDDLKCELRENKIDCKCELSETFIKKENANLRGAFLRAISLNSI
jgi:predicted NBD/HSP70 family sugar kinase